MENTTRTVLTSQPAPNHASCSITSINLTVSKHWEEETELKTAQLEIFRDRDVNKAQLQADSAMIKVSTTYVALKSSEFLIK